MSSKTLDKWIRFADALGYVNRDDSGRIGDVATHDVVLAEVKEWNAAYMEGIDAAVAIDERDAIRSAARALCDAMPRCCVIGCKRVATTVEGACDPCALTTTRLLDLMCGVDDVDTHDEWDRIFAAIEAHRVSRGAR